MPVPQMEAEQCRAGRQALLGAFEQLIAGGFGVRSRLGFEDEHRGAKVPHFFAHPGIVALEPCYLRGAQLGKRLPVFRG